MAIVMRKYIEQWEAMGSNRDTKYGGGRMTIQQARLSQCMIDDAMMGDPGIQLGLRMQV